MVRLSQHPTEQVGSATESPTLTSKIRFLLVVIVILRALWFLISGKV